PLTLALSMSSLGDFYFDKKIYDSAFHYYHVAIPMSVQTSRSDIVMQCQLGIAKIFLKSDGLDSALVDANKVIIDAGSLPDSAMMAEASFLLSDIFKKQNKIDSAYKYLKYAITLKDFLSEQEKIKKVKDMMFNETL